MKKNKKIIFILFICLLLNITNVKADKTSGSSINYKPGPTSGSGKISEKGYYINNNLGYRISIVKVDKKDSSKYKVLAQKDYISNDAYYREAKKAKNKIYVNSATTMKNKTRMGIIDRYSTGKNVGWKYAGTAEEYFGTKGGDEKKVAIVPSEIDKAGFSKEKSRSWKSVADYYNGVAKDFGKTKKLFKDLGINLNDYTTTTVSRVCPNGYTLKDDHYCYKDLTTSYTTTTDQNVNSESSCKARCTNGTAMYYGRRDCNATWNSTTKTCTFTYYKLRTETYEETNAECTNNHNARCKGKTDCSSKYYSPLSGKNNPFAGKNVCIVSYSGEKIKSTKQVCKEYELEYLYAIVEPMFTIGTAQNNNAKNQKTYYGTSTELSNLTINSNNSGFENLNNESKFKEWASYLYMTEDSFKLDSNTYKFSKIIKKMDSNADKEIKNFKKANLTSKTKQNNILGVGVGLIWLGSNKENEKACPTPSTAFKCVDTNDVEHDIDSCVDTLEKSGYKESAAIGICEIEYCDSPKTVCEECTDEGYKKYKTLTRDDLTTYLKTLDKATYETEGKIKEAATSKKTEFINNNCKNSYYEVSSDPSSLFCKNEIESNIGEIKIKYQKNQEKSNENGGNCTTVNNTNIYGDKMAEIGSCSIYCKESANLVLPGGYKGSVKVGGNFVWPVNTNKNNNYEMKITYNLECKAINNSSENASCNGSVGDAESFINGLEFQNDAILKYNYGDGDGTEQSINLQYDKKNITSTGFNNALTDKSDLKASLTYNYYLPTGLNKYVDNNRNYFNEDSDKSSAILPLLKVNENSGALIVSKNANKKQYDLKLDIKFGIDNSIGSLITNYVCHYNVTGDNGDDCKCPTDSKHPNLDISKYLPCDYNLDGKNDENSYEHVCANGQIELCYKDVIDEEKIGKSCKCEYKIGGETRTVDISQCITGDNSFQFCYHKYCESICKEDCTWRTIYDGYVIVQNKYCSNSDGINDRICDTIVLKRGCDDDCEEPCVERELHKLGEINDENVIIAMQKCNKKDVVYRVIDLNDPFPGMTLKGQVRGFNTNNDTKGRYPGTNWKSLFWVTNKIRNINSMQRKISGYNIYNETPLYTIELSPSDIKSIRDYNEKNDYSSYKDFNCDSSTGVCVSNFLRASTYSNIFTSGLCKNANNAAELKNCYENYSSTSSVATYKR